MMPSKNILVAILVIIVLVAGGAYYLRQQSSKPPPTSSSDEYLFIEYYTYTHGELIEGNYPMKMIDFPTYSFDPKTGTLEGWMNFEINDSLKVVYGSGSSLSGAAGGGAASMLSGVYLLPYEDEKLKILRIDSDGTAHLEYNGLPITLKGGEEWTNTTTRVDVQQFDSNKGIAKLTITEKVMNHGFINRSKITNTQP